MLIGLAASCGRANSAIMIAYFRLFLLVAIGSIIAFVLLQTKKILPDEAQIAATTETVTKSQRSKINVQIGMPVKITTQSAQPSRDVGGGIVRGQNQQSLELERIEPLPQPTPPPLVKPLEAKNPKILERWRLVYNSVATSAGVFQLTDNAFVLPGIDAVTVDERCAMADGNSWPCGMVARTSLRSFINGKALTCKLPDIMTEKSIVADCNLRGRDLAQWLVANGWARAKADGPYLQDQLDAKSKRLGIYGEPPTGVATLAQ